MDSIWVEVQRPATWTAATPSPEATRSRAIPTRGECPEKRPINPAAFAAAAIRFDTARPERRPKTQAFGEASGRRIARSAAAPALPTYRVAPVPSWSLLERRTVTRADPSLRNSTSAQVSAAASERRSKASRMTDTSAISTSPRRRALLARSVRPPGPVRRRQAFARIAANPSSVSAAACLGVRPSRAARRVSPRSTRRTPSLSAGFACPASV